MIEDFRKIRRVSLEDKFFEEYNLEIGDGFKCPHCGKIIDINHPVYQKLRRCNHCSEELKNE